MMLLMVFATAISVSSCGGDDDESEDVIVKDPIVGTSWEGNSSSASYRFDFLENSVRVTASKNAFTTKSVMGTWSKSGTNKYSINTGYYDMDFVFTDFTITVEGDKATAQGFSKFTLYKVK